MNRSVAAACIENAFEATYAPHLKQFLSQAAHGLLTTQKLINRGLTTAQISSSALGKSNESSPSSSSVFV